MCVDCDIQCNCTCNKSTEKFIVASQIIEAYATKIRRVHAPQWTDAFSVSFIVNRVAISKSIVKGQACLLYL